MRDMGEGARVYACKRKWFGLVLVIALRPQAPKHIRGGWSHYTDTSEPVDSKGAQNMVTVQSGFRIMDLSITRQPPALNVPTGKLKDAVIIIGTLDMER
jgi:hypothetical protein